MKQVRLNFNFPLPTWNRILAMDHRARMRLRHLIHSFVADSLSFHTDTETQTQTVSQRRPLSMDLYYTAYLRAIRPNKSNSSPHKLKSSKKKKWNGRKF